MTQQQALKNVVMFLEVEDIWGKRGFKKIADHAAKQRDKYWQIYLDGGVKDAGI
ncbi:hypothetical protein [Aureibacillus halotolerans]|uniref:Uncharacterized protein n=1 Tax=Aureibacillus halotolerans TaxID=1508390 RepID=A0A4R6U434_9BACI|nr:hypothetical protein [Aureibacillus halotolerans]TDQ39195.1 hypothetical protein EV213_108147 [Aureibacillus halotolerans]